MREDMDMETRARTWTWKYARGHGCENKHEDKLSIKQTEHRDNKCID